ncbi:MAG: phosphatase PAP2 family protein [Gemmatimonadales bacterium]
MLTRSEITPPSVHPFRPAATTRSNMIEREPTTASADEIPVRWSGAGRFLMRPYPVTWPMVLLVGLIPVYLVIAGRAETGPVHTPATALDRLLPLVPAWAIVYGALYGFLILVPVFVVGQPDLIRRTVWAYLMVWSTAYLGFLLYPTVAPRPDAVVGEGFAAWGLRFLYGADPPYNCFPSLHVAHSFVSAFACSRVHRPLGLVAIAGAALVALSTLFTRQHYVADLIGGILLAAAAYGIFLRGYPRSRTPDRDRRLAPRLAVGAAAIVGLGAACFWVAYRLGA